VKQADKFVVKNMTLVEKLAIEMDFLTSFV